MVLYHVVLFKFRQNITAEESARFVAGVDSLKNIEGVLSIQCGEISTTLYQNYNDRTKGYTHSLLAVLRDADALEIYDKSSFHEQVKQEFIIPLIDKTLDTPYMAVDYFGKLPEKPMSEPVASSSYSQTAICVGAAAAVAAIAGFVLFRAKL